MLLVLVPFLLTVLSLLAPVKADLKAVFAHYMLGTMSADEAVRDVQDAKAIGIDAFAVNVQNTQDPWAVNSIKYIFDAAEKNNFKLFFSFDMAVRDQVSYFLPVFVQYHNSAAYYKHNNLPFVSTFWGATLSFGYSTPNQGWQTQLRDALNAQGIPIYFVPSFSNAPNGPSNFFQTYPVVDGVFSWDSTWPYESQGNVNVSSAVDKQYLAGARSASKTFMMGISPLQFKHIDGGQNWYLKGELNMGLRIGQILDVAPDFIEIITWNDGGESHNIGNVWPEGISGTPIPGYTDGYNHAGWKQLIPPLVKAFKAGTKDLTSLTPPSGRVSGSFWYRPLLTTASCRSDPLGKPRGWQNAQDTINIALFLADAGGAVTVYSGNKQIALYKTTKGLNTFATPGLVPGPVSVNVWNAAGALVTFAASGVDVAAGSSGVCNFNYQTVAVVA